MGSDACSVTLWQSNAMRGPVLPGRVLPSSCAFVSGLMCDATGVRAPCIVLVRRVCSNCMLSGAGGMSTCMRMRTDSSLPLSACSATWHAA